MCIVFIYVDNTNSDSDYKLIVISNRDELYDRPAQKMGPWCKDASVYGGRDLQTGCEGGTWLAVSPSLRKLGLLLNLPGDSKLDAKSRGKIVENFMKSDLQTKEFVESMKYYFQKCNGFVLVAIEFRTFTPHIQTYSNANNELKEWNDKYLGFSNNLPENPLKKVEAGKCKLEECCNKFHKLEDKEKLIDELIGILKSEERYLPDQQLEQRHPHNFNELSSIFVKIPSRRYGTRAHTIILVGKTAKMDIIEISMKSPINPMSPCWERTEFQLNLS